MNAAQALLAFMLNGARLEQPMKPPPPKRTYARWHKRSDMGRVRLGVKEGRVTFVDTPKLQGGKGLR